MSFTLHPQLEADTFLIGNADLSTVRLMNDSRFPWLILIPRVDGASDLIDLCREDQLRLLSEIDSVSHALQTRFAPDKLNVAALGNMVPQLHVHVIARYTTDAAWPAPVWGTGTTEPYAPDVAGARAHELKLALGISA